MPLPITLAMIVRNESTFLPRCLASVEGIVAHRVVLDTGSTDDTIALAEHAGAEVHTMRWPNDFAKARNAVQAFVRTPWTLVMDADETFVRADAALLEAAVLHPTAAAYNLRIVSLAERAEQLSEAYVTRLYRTDPRIVWTGRVHEQVIPSLQAHRIPLALSPIRILHAGYLPGVMALRQKAERNRDLLERELAQNPHDPYVQWQLAQTLLQCDAIPRAQFLLRKAQKHLPLRHPLRPLCAVTEIKTYLLTQDYRKASTVLHAAQQAYPTYTDLAYLKGQMACIQQHWAEGAAAFEEALRLGTPTEFLQTETGVGSFKALWGLTQCAYHQQDTQRLEVYLLLTLKTAPAFREAWQFAAQVYANTPIALVGQQLTHVMTPTAIREALQLWTDRSIWETALLAWAEAEAGAAAGPPPATEAAERANDPVQSLPRGGALNGPLAESCTSEGLSV